MKKIFLGMSIVTSLFAQSVSVTQSWQLLGTNDDIDITVFNKECVKAVWKYNENSWSVYLPDSEDVTFGIEFDKITSIGKEKGFWILGNSSCEIDTSTTQTSTYIDSNMPTSFVFTCSQADSGEIAYTNYYANGTCATGGDGDILSGTCSMDGNVFSYQDSIGTSVMTFTSSTDVSVVNTENGQQAEQETCTYTTTPIDSSRKQYNFTCSGETSYVEYAGNGTCTIGGDGALTNGSCFMFGDILYYSDSYGTSEITFTSSSQASVTNQDIGKSPYTETCTYTIFSF